MAKTRTEQISARLPDFMIEWLRLGTDGLTGELKDSVRLAMISYDFERYRDIYAGDLDLIQVLNITPTMIESENPDESTAMVAYILVQGAAAKLAEAVSSMVRTGAIDPKVTERIRLWLLIDRATFNNQGEDIVIYLSRRWRNHVELEGKPLAA
jgi:hypothetical protein